MLRFTLGTLLLAVLAWTVPGAALEGLQPGMKAPDFSLESFQGKTVALRDVANVRALVVVFWSSWSEKSPEVLDRLQKLYGRYRDQGLAVVGINVESPKPTAEEMTQVRALAQKLGLGFPLLMDQIGRAHV